MKSYSKQKINKLVFRNIVNIVKILKNILKKLHLRILIINRLILVVNISIKII